MKMTLHKNEDSLRQNKDNLTQNMKTISPQKLGKPHPKNKDDLTKQAQICAYLVAKVNALVIKILYFILYGILTFIL